MLNSAKGQRGRLVISKEEEARSYQAELKDASYVVAEVKKREVRQRPTAPFTTSTMQQEAGRKLGPTFPIWLKSSLSNASLLFQLLCNGSQSPFSQL